MFRYTTLCLCTFLGTTFFFLIPGSCQISNASKRECSRYPHELDKAKWSSCDNVQQINLLLSTMGNTQFQERTRERIILLLCKNTNRKRWANYKCSNILRHKILKKKCMFTFTETRRFSFKGERCVTEILIDFIGYTWWTHGWHMHAN